MEAKDKLLFNNIITQNPILASLVILRAWFWHVASDMMDPASLHYLQKWASLHFYVL